MYNCDIIVAIAGKFRETLERDESHQDLVKEQVMGTVGSRRGAIWRTREFYQRESSNSIESRRVIKEQSSNSDSENESYSECF